jgi:murein DD-endopeptidase MepM/ murein hydrolase activator NlpD
LIARTAVLLCLLATPAVALDLHGQLTQGALVTGQARPGDQVLLGGKAIKVAPDGLFVIGFARDQAPSAQLTVIHQSGAVEQQHLDIAQRTYDIQRIDKLDQNMVTPDDATVARMQAEQAKINTARVTSTSERDFLGPFIWPAKGPVSGVYGSQRILNGEPRQPHFGLDIAAPEGSPVVAPAPGVVRLAEPDFFLTGGTVILDHGFNVNSTFIHMEEVDVKVGQVLKQGDLIGHVGKKGRATGPHLHWAMNWGEVRVDPQLLLPPLPTD